MSLFPCCTTQKRPSKIKWKKSIKEDNDNKSVVSFSNISFKSDSGKRKFITDEIAKLGKGNITSRIISYHELCVATRNFHPTNMIGEGGFGRVYKGYLKSTNEAQPLLKDRKKFIQMADPLLKDKYPIKSLYQALAVAAMCLQEEDETRPIISDVVTAIEFLARKRVEVDEPQPRKEISPTQEEDSNHN
ncbi:hypothetical protein ACSQ67_011610 [Phaseolus vulgaris]